MGLDISLQVAATARLERLRYKVEDEWYENIPDNGDLSYEERKSLRDSYIADRIPADIRAAADNAQPFEPVSKVDTEHINTPTYLRSSYNESGFDSVVPRRLNDEYATYEGIFGGIAWKDADGNPTDEGYPGGFLNKDDIPALRVVQGRALEVAKRLEDADPYDVTFVGANPFADKSTLPKSATEALQVFRDQAEKTKGKDAPYNYSTSSGHFFEQEALTIVAAIPGAEHFREQGVYLVFERDKDDDFYFKAALIAAEFAQATMNLIERDGEAYVSWSG